MHDAFTINATRTDQALASPSTKKRSQTTQWLAKKCAETLRSALDLDEEHTRLLEFGCGGGALAMHLCQDVASYTGIDASSKAVARLNERFSHQGLEPSEAQAHCFNVHHQLDPPQTLASPSNPSLHIDPVDCLVASMVHHHLPDPTSTTALLIHHFLKPGGTVAILDLVYNPAHDHLFSTSSLHQGHVREDGVCWHGGFSRETALSWIAQTGCTDITYEGQAFSLTRTLSSPPSQYHFSFFLLTAKKPLSSPSSPP
ncbi:MAG: S-adenosyl-L-methionine-dependent methyltransferase [Piptocephalis tieghemiana]|nr:MAG: S-adenosyl-L-methionine-dependent methyltransferase [Piptocephalis tieghemiana]